MKHTRGFTLIELLLVVAILTILFLVVYVSIHRVNERAQDVRIRNDVKQLRLLAEQAYDSQGATYENWSVLPIVADQVIILRNNIDETLGDGPGAPWLSTITENREKEYCISSPLVAQENGNYYCVDGSGQFKIINTPCPPAATDNQPLVCPPS